MSDVALEIAGLRAALDASQARAQAAETELAQVRATVSCSEAMIKELKLEIAKLRRDKYGISSERSARLVDQLELQLEELEATATEDGPVRSKATFSARFSHSVENKQLFSFFVTCNTEQKSGFYKRLKPKEEFYVPYILSFGTISAEIDLI